MNIEKKIVACPYCGQSIDNSVEKCPSCGELFAEPKIRSLKFISVPLYIVSETVSSCFFSFYLYTLFWLTVNFKAFFKMANKKDAKKLVFLFSLFFITFLAFFMPIICKSEDITSVVQFYLSLKILFLWIAFFVEIFLSYRILRIIEKYTQKEYGSCITHNELWMVIFRTLYVIYFISTYSERVKNPDSRYFLDTEGWFEYTIILIILVLALFRF